MRKAFRHTGVLMMVAVVALGLIGASYTLWYEKLTMTTTVTTGNLDANWSIHSWSNGAFSANSTATGNGQPVVHVATAAETVLNGGVATVLSDGLLKGKTTDASYSLFLESNFPAGKPKPTCTASGGNGNDLVLTMSDLFPYAGCEFQLDLHSAGSVPFHMAITDVKVEQLKNGQWVTPDHPGNMPWSRGFPNWNDNGDGQKCFSFFSADWKGTIPGQINLLDANLASTGVPLQIHPDHDLVCNFKLILDENWWDGVSGTSGNPAHYFSNQGLTFRITVKYVAYQWNEQPSGTLHSTLP